MNIVTGYTGTPHVTSQQERNTNMSAFGEGSYILPYGSKLAATITGANEVTLADGGVSLQGCVAEIPYGQSEVLTLDAGASGMYRYDLICAQYQNNSSVESMQIVVKKGTATSGTPSVPSYTSGSIAAGDTVVEMPLFRVYFNGLSVQSVTRVADVFEPLSNVIATIRNALEWRETAPPVTGTTWTPLLSNDSKEVFVSVLVASNTSVEFVIPVNSYYFPSSGTHKIVNYYGATYDGYVAVWCKYESGHYQVALNAAYNGTTDKTSTAQISIYER